MRGSLARARGLRRLKSSVAWWTIFISPSGIAPTLVLDHAGAAGGQYRANNVDKTFSELHTFTRASIATRVNSSGNIETVASGAHRLDHDKDGNRIGLLVVVPRTNLFTRSAEFDHADWSKARATVDADATTSPDGGTNADRLGDNNSTGSNSVLLTSPAITVATSTQYTYSLFAKADQLSWVKLHLISFTTPANGGAFFNLSAGTIGTTDAGYTASIKDYGNGWYRCSITFTTDAVDTSGNARVFLADADGDTTVDLDGTSSVFIWGAQFEAGAFPTSYIPTTTVAVARAAETSVSATSGWNHSETAGSLYWVGTPNHTPDATTGELILFSLNDGTTNEVIEAYADTSANVRFRVTVGGVDQCDIDSGVNAVGGTELKIAVAWAANDFVISVNGASVVADTGGTLPTVTQLEPCENGHTKQLVAWSSRLVDGDVEAMTA